MSKSVSIDTFAVTSGYRTCLIHHVDKRLRIVSKETTDRVTFILTREDHFDQGREFMQSESASDQTSGGWNTKVEKGEVISTLKKIGEGGSDDIQLSVAAS